MSKYIRAATAAVASYLQGRTVPVLLFDVSCVADSAARTKGKKRDLFTSLFHYSDLKPPGWSGRWLTSGQGATSLYCLVPPGWRPATTEAPKTSLVFDSGKAREATLAEVGD